MNDVARVAGLLRERNRIDAALSACIRRPALPGHLGDWIASQVFGIELEQQTTARGVDGRFADGRTVNIRWYAKRDNLLDLREDGPDSYLVLTGPKAPAESSVGAVRPLVIDAVYLFDAAAVVADLRARGCKIGVASSVRAHVWEAAEVYPRHNPEFVLTLEQRELLALFSHQP
ncbi:hypothetical protein [Lentzea flava]|uniref:Uncharacterized protein n=1 Tax=Lentzea flava TaxID=103732 RepID=A0ABQ2UE70_9PSEU|nr:hypothetical protein [Lentzea flava]MCP2198527.1 hypothetical protein [Lentzea flava]GGU26491.1 hypothetical protein GCM10010178_18570 [Lentzea flava]